ncbi:MAG: hypothetical protein IPK79_10405 [Vampirovibrionales bacterium]|nr:hypothetical protein [Vampirovibrionales bacterium]
MMMMAAACTGGPLSRADVLAHYQCNGQALIEGCAGYPLVLKRYPEGAQGDYYFVHRQSQLPPEIRERLTYRDDDAILIPDAQTLYSLVEAGFWTIQMALRPADEGDPAIRPLWVGWQACGANSGDEPLVIETILKLRDMLRDCGHAGVVLKPNARHGWDAMLPLRRALDPPDAQVWADTLAMQLASDSPQCHWAEALPDEARRKGRRVYVATSCNRPGMGLIAPWSLCDPLQGVFSIPQEPSASDC